VISRIHREGRLSPDQGLDQQEFRVAVVDEGRRLGQSCRRQRSRLAPAQTGARGGYFESRSRGGNDYNGFQIGLNFVDRYH
ncbi:MAG: hypothetical protein O7B81_00560, partial [Gammaproteobacteria bacterium]|nr:hypothetical protein [Gammaproteobacteria bacterium]